MDLTQGDMKAQVVLKRRKAGVQRQLSARPVQCTHESREALIKST